MVTDKRIAVVTGATGALGRVVTRDLVERGIQVVCPYRHDGSLNELKAILGPLSSSLTAVQGDVSVEEDVKRLFERALSINGRVDILLNIAGAYRGGSELQNTSVDDWDAMMNTNLKSAFLCSRAVLPSMIQNNSGKIVSVAARPAVEKRYRVKSGAYSVSKAGVAVLTETIAEEVRKYDINVNAVMPSTIDSPDNRKNMPQADTSKWVKPEDISRVIMYLISDDSKVTSGALVPVYGKA
jgi:NAD(P)-dependent dehydrogenase (short-subunit alcohol dehydrogenase family)